MSLQDVDLPYISYSAYILNIFYIDFLSTFCKSFFFLKLQGKQVGRNLATWIKF